MIAEPDPRGHPPWFPQLRLEVIVNTRPATLSHTTHVLADPDSIEPGH